MSLRYGHVTEVGKGQARVEFPDLDGAPSWWLSILYPTTHGDKDYWLPAKGTLVACLLDKHGEDGAILGAIYAGENAPPMSEGERVIEFEDGTKLSYDKSSKALTIDCQGPVIVQGAEGVTIDCPSGKTVGIGGADDVLVKKSWLTALEARLDANESATVTAVTAAGPGGPAAGPTLQTAYGTSKTTYATAKANGATTKLKGG